MASKEVCEALSAVATFVGFLNCSNVAREKQYMHKNELLAVLFGPVSKEMLEGKLVRHGPSSRSIQHAKKVVSESPGLVESVLCLPDEQVKFSGKMFFFFFEVQLNPSISNSPGKQKIV